MKNRDLATVLHVLSEKIDELECSHAWKDIRIQEIQAKLEKTEEENAKLTAERDELHKRVQDLLARYDG